MFKFICFNVSKTDFLTGTEKAWRTIQINGLNSKVIFIPRKILKDVTEIASERVKFKVPLYFFENEKTYFYRLEGVDMEETILTSEV